MEVLTWGPGTKAYRLVLLGAVLAGTPIGQNILNSIGIRTPVAEQLEALKTQVDTVKTDVSHVKDDVSHVKDDVAAVKAKSDKLDTAFSGFQVDFNKYRTEHP